MWTNDSDVISLVKYTLLWADEAKLKQSKERIKNAFFMVDGLITFHKVSYQLEHRFIAFEADGLVGIINGVIEWESIAFLILEENARHVACSEGVVVAIASQLATVQ